MSSHKLILGLTVFSCSLLGAIAGAKAEVEPKEELTVAQAEVTQEEKKELRTGFFEEERRQRFGFGDFLDVALDGADNAFGNDRINTPTQGIQADALTSREFAPIGGTISINVDSDSDNFLQGGFVGPGVSLQFNNVQQGSTPQRGTLNLAPGSVINGRQVSGFRQYNGAGNEKNGVFTGRIQLVDPNNPTDTIYIQVPPTRNLSNDDDFGRGPGRLSIGRPVDR
jgi:hypothetical protein